MHFPKRRGKFPAQSHVVFAAAVTVEAMEERVLMTAFTQGNLAVLDLATNTSNSSGSILELSPSTAAQLTPVQTIAIPATGVNAMRFSNSGTSSYLSDTNDHTLLALTGYNTADTTDSDLATVTAADPANDRAVATLNNSAAYALQTTYTGVTGNQIRSASSTDNSHWYIADKGGLYTNNATTASDALNIGQVRSFGGTVYVSTTRTVAQGNTANSAITTAASPTASSFTGLPGIAVDANIADFYLIQSGSNGANYDILYKLDGTSITKYSLVSGSWTSNGTYTLPTAGLSMIAANDGAGGANLYYTTGTSVVQLTDTTGWVNSTTASTTNFTVTTANNVTLYTATGTNFLKGLDFAPVAPAPIPSIASVATNPTFVFQGSGTISLSATVSETGGSASSVSFYREAANGTENPAVDTLIAGTATNAGGTWTLGGVSTSGLAVGTYSYYAVATDSTHATVSTTSPVATLTVYTQAPTVTSQPASQYAAAGASVAFTSTGVGSPTPSVQWQVLTAPGGTWMNLVDTAGQISGSGMPTLTLSGLTEGQSGYQYRAVFMSSSGTALSNPATLTVTGTPIAQWIFPGGEAPPTGGSTAVGTGNSPLPSYGSSNDVAGTLGLSNDYTGVQAFPESDILVERSTLDPAFSEFDWRIRSGNGSGPTGSPGTPEGWSQNAPQYAQGVQFDVDTTGYSNITLHFDWNQGGISDMQPIYSTNGGTSWTPLPAELIEQTTPKGDFYGLNPGTTTTAAYSLIAGASSAVSVASSMGFTLNETVIIGSINCTVTAITPGVLTVTPAATGSVASGAAVGQTPTGILVNLQSIAGANNNPNFELQLAAAYNATLPLITDGNLDLNGGNTSIAHGQYATGVAGPVNAQQVIQFGSNENSTSDVTGGTFTLSYGGVPTAAISYSSTPATLAANISAALSALTINGVPHYLSGNFTVAQTNTPGVNPERDGLGVVASDMTVTFSGALASTAVATMTANGSALTGNSPSISVATWVNGSTMGFQPYVDGSGAWQIGNISFNGDGVSAGGLAIINQPASLTAITSSAGHPATASFTATSYSENPTTAQWQINTGSGWNNITGATNISQSGSTWTSTYSFPTDTTTDQSGNQYRVVFTALGNGVTSNAATLTVVAPVVPSIVLQPIATSVQAGNTAILLASATGTPLPTVQWQINNGSGWNNIAGATSTTLQYTTLVDGSENGDQIRAVFTNQAGSATSNAVVLTVLAAETDVTNWDFTNHSTIVTPTTIVPLTGLATTAGSNTITVTSTTGLTVGQAITGTNIPAGSLITAITDAATFTISTTPTVTGSLGVGSATAAGFDNSPAPTGGSLDVGAAYPVGLDLPYTPGDAATGTDGNGAVDASDVTNSPGALNPNFNENTWRPRSGPTITTGGTPANGFSNLVPEYTQGVQFNASTAGYNDVYVTMDWYSTTSGELDAQEQYTVGGTTVSISSASTSNNIPETVNGNTTSVSAGTNVVATLSAPNNFQFGDEVTVSGLGGAYNGTYQIVGATANSFSYYVPATAPTVNGAGSAYVPTWININNQIQAVSNDFYGATATGGPIPIVIDVSAIPGAVNNPNFGVRLVNAYNAILSNTQTLDLGDTSSFTLKFNGNTTSTIAYSANASMMAANVQAALAALPGVGVGNVTVSAPSGQSSTLSITFGGALNVKAQPAIVATDSKDTIVYNPQYANAALVLQADGTQGPAAYNGSKGNWRFGNIEVHGVAIATAPALVGSPVVNGNNTALAGVQRSTVSSIVYTFSQPVNIASTNAFSIAVVSGQAGTAPTLGWAAISPDANGASTQWVVTFSGSGVSSGSIANGVYAITINAASVTAETGGMAMAAGRTDTFWRLFGDYGGQQTVNSTDKGRFNLAFGTSQGAPNYIAAFDSNANNTIDNTDKGRFNLDFGVAYTGFTPTI